MPEAALAKEWAGHAAGTVLSTDHEAASVIGSGRVWVDSLRFAALVKDGLLSNPAAPPKASQPAADATDLSSQAGGDGQSPSASSSKPDAKG